MSVENHTASGPVLQEPLVAHAGTKSLLLTLAYLNQTQALLTGFFVLIAVYGSRKIQNYFRLSHFKGPWLAGWSRIWILRTVLSGQMNLRFYDIIKKYGMLLYYPPADRVAL